MIFVLMLSGQFEVAHDLVLLFRGQNRVAHNVCVNAKETLKWLVMWFYCLGDRIVWLTMFVLMLRRQFEVAHDLVLLIKR